MNIGLKSALFLRCWILVRRLLEARDLPKTSYDVFHKTSQKWLGGGVNTKTKHSYQSESIARFMY